MKAYIEVIDNMTGETKYTMKKGMFEFANWITRAAMRRFEIIESADGNGFFVSPTNDIEKNRFKVYFE